MRTLLALLLFAGFASGQSVNLPPEIKVPVGRLASILIEWDGDEIKWDIPPDLADVFREYDPDPKKVRLKLLGYTAGKARLVALATKAVNKGTAESPKWVAVFSEVASCTITIGEPVPPIPPGPDPKPPDPIPPTPPAPIPEAGFRVLILYESDPSNVAKLNQSQMVALNGQAVRSYLSSKCIKVNNQPEWRFFDKDGVFAKNADPIWQKAMARPRTSVPWVIISDGKTGHEGKLPETGDEILALLKKYGGQ